MDGRMIAEKRKAMGLTQDALGAMLGISGKAVSKWDRGLSKPCAEHLTQLINLLGLPHEQLPKASKPDTCTILSTIRREIARIISISIMIAVCICNLRGIISLNSTVVSLGFSMIFFCFGTIMQNL